MKKIPLTRGKSVLVDDEDFEWLNRWRWHTQVSEQRCYAVRNIWAAGKCYTVRMHRLIMHTPNGMEVDHRDYNGLNNQRSNLRNCTRAQNQHNRKKYKNNTGGFKGVSLVKSCNPFKGTIRMHGKTIHIGFFPDAISAAKAYDAKAKELFGEFARLNFPERSKP